MVSIIGVDSRIFEREVVKRNNKKGHFKSVLGIAVKVSDYLKFNKAYEKVIKNASKKINLKNDYQYYCINDIKDNKNLYEFLEFFAKEISKHTEKIHVFYTLFSKKRMPEAKVYGRLAKKEKLKLSEPSRTYEKLVSKHLVQCFPAVCAWKLSEYLSPKTVEFHLDFYEGHIFEGQERLKQLGFKIFTYPGGDCSNPIISTADLLIGLLDMRLKKSNNYLLFENIRPALPEFGENLLVYPILNKHLRFITPVFKGDSLIDSGTMKRSPTFRNLIDFASSQYGVVKMFEKGKDIEYFFPGDFGVYINSAGKELIDNYIALGKPFKLFDLNTMVSKIPGEKQKHLNIAND